MTDFKKVLAEEGLPGERGPHLRRAAVVKNLSGKMLKTTQVNRDKDFKRDGDKPALAEPDPALLRYSVTLDWVTARGRGAQRRSAGCSSAAPPPAIKEVKSV